MQPILFLDIDGVLNPYPGMGKTGDWPDYDNYDVENERFDSGLTVSKNYVLRLSKLMGEAINSLGCDIIWCTTWESQAHKVGSIIGIEADYLRLGEGWKRAAVERYIAHDPRPFAWFEDMPYFYGCEQDKPWHRDTPPRHIINPQHNRGLTREDIESTRRWVDRVTSPAVH